MLLRNRIDLFKVQSVNVLGAVCVNKVCTILLVRISYPYVLSYLEAS